MATTKSKPDPAAAAVIAYEESIKDNAKEKVTLALAERTIYRDHGFTYVDDRANPPVERVDNEGIKDAIFGILPNHRADTKEERTSEPIHRYELTGQILTGLPVPPPYGDSDEWDAVDALERAAWFQCESHIWKLVQDKANSPLQRKVRDDMDEEVVMVKAGDFLYLTAEPKFVQSDIYRPLTDKAEIAFVSAAEQMAMFTKQLPALKGRGVPALNAATKRAGEKARAAYTLASSDEGNGGDEQE